MEGNARSLFDRYFGPFSCLLGEIQDSIGIQKKYAQRTRKIAWVYNVFFQISILILGFSATIMAALSATNSNLVQWVIIPTALVTLMNGIASFLDFQSETGRLSDLRASLAELESRVDLDIVLAICDAQSSGSGFVTKIADKTVPEYLKQRHRELSDLLMKTERSRRSGGHKKDTKLVTR